MASSVSHRNPSEPPSEAGGLQRNQSGGSSTATGSALNSSSSKSGGHQSSPTAASSSSAACFFGRFPAIKLRDDNSGDLSMGALVDRHRFLLCTMSVLLVLCTIYLYFAVTMGEEYALCDRLEGVARDECRASFAVRMGEGKSERRRLMGLLGRRGAVGGEVMVAGRGEGGETGGGAVEALKGQLIDSLVKEVQGKTRIASR